VFVPGTSFAVVNVDGSGRVTELANEYGNNDIWFTPPFSDPVTNYAQDALTGTPNEGNEGLFPITALANSSGAWEWWDEAVVTAGATAVGGNPATVLANGYASNPVYQALGPVAGRARALAYIDTLQNFITPRMFRVLGFASAIDESSTIATGVEVFPIPATERVTITSSAAVIRNYVVYDGQGRMVRNGNVNLDRVVLEREGLKAGNYYVELFFDEGSLTKKVILD
jgi:hypothetical protein